MLRTLCLLAAPLLVFAALASPARADPPADPNAIITFDIENDAPDGTDRLYTSGLHLAYTSPTGAVPDFISQIGRSLWGEGVQRYSIALDQLLFTPIDTQIAPPNPFDRPYAGLLLGSYNLIQDTDTTRSVLGLSAGMLGPSALGEEVQNGFHSLIGQTTNKGWNYQIPNEPVLEVLSERTWRLPTGTLAGIETDVLPDLTAAVGNWRDYAQTGGVFRIGQGLDSDFGAPRMRPGLSGSDAYTPTRNFVWYLFGGADGQAVAYDATLNGNPFTGGAHVTPNILVGEAEAGLAMIIDGVRLSYTQVWQTQEFKNQRGGVFQFGVFTVSARF